MNGHGAGGDIMPCMTGTARCITTCPDGFVGTLGDDASVLREDAAVTPGGDGTAGNGTLIYGCNLTFPYLRSATQRVSLLPSVGCFNTSHRGFLVAACLSSFLQIRHAFVPHLISPIWRDARLTQQRTYTSSDVAYTHAAGLPLRSTSQQHVPCLHDVALLCLTFYYPFFTHLLAFLAFALACARIF